MDGGGGFSGGGWQSSGSGSGGRWYGGGSEQDSGSGSGGGGSGSASSDASFLGVQEADPPYYGTNNNDYSKYKYDPATTTDGGGKGGYLPHPTAGSPAGGYYTSASHQGTTSHYACWGTDSDHLHAQCPERHSDYGSSQCYSDRHSYDAYSSQPGYSEYRQEYAPSRVQVTAKVLFGSVSAISNLKQKKNTKKK